MRPASQSTQKRTPDSLLARFFIHSNRLKFTNPGDQFPNRKSQQAVLLLSDKPGTQRSLIFIELRAGLIVCTFPVGRFGYYLFEREDRVNIIPRHPANDPAHAGCVFPATAADF